MNLHDTALAAILTGTDREAATALVSARARGAGPERLETLTRAYITRLESWTDAMSAQDLLLPSEGMSEEEWDRLAA